MLQKAIKEIILDPTCLYQLENINNSSEEVVILHNTEKTSIDEYLKSIDPIRIMKFNNKTHMNWKNKLKINRTTNVLNEIFKLKKVLLKC